MKMAILSDPTVSVMWVLCSLLLLQGRALSYLFKVGDLDSWGVPPSASPKIYSSWSQENQIRIGDSLLFLYPPSEDSVIQVTEDAYNICNTSNPIAYFDDGNTVFNVTGLGTFYFTSGVNGHCQKCQKIAIAIPSNGTSHPSSLPPSTLPQASYPAVFGPTGSTSSAPTINIAFVRTILLVAFLSVFSLILNR